MIKFKNYIVIILIILMAGCSSVTIDPSKQQINVRHVIVECETFDCSVLSKEIKILKEMIEKNDVNQGIQQSLVTSITRICNSDIDDKKTPCQKYQEERKKLNY